MRGSDHQHTPSRIARTPRTGIAIATPRGTATRQIGQSNRRFSEWRIIDQVSVGKGGRVPINKVAALTLLYYSQGTRIVDIRPELVTTKHVDKSQRRKKIRISVCPINRAPSVFRNSGRRKEFLVPKTGSFDEARTDPSSLNSTPAGVSQSFFLFSPQ